MRLIGCLILLLLTATSATAADPPNVVASIRPLHSLAAGVMGNLGTPDLIVNGYGSPHVYQMRPSEARALAAADVVLWIGEALETFMAGPIRNLSGNARVVSVLDADGLHLHPARTSNLWDNEHDHDGDHVSADPHVWLAPENAKAIVDVIALALSEADPERAAIYAANGTQVKARIDALDARLQAQFSDVADVPFIVFHDSLHYFESAFGLHSVGAVTLDPDRQPGAGSVRALRQRISERGVECFVVEPQFTPALVETLAPGTATMRVVFDPIGTELPLGADNYFEMMNSNADNLARCLEAHSRYP